MPRTPDGPADSGRNSLASPQTEESLSLEPIGVFTEDDAQWRASRKWSSPFLVSRQNFDAASSVRKLLVVFSDNAAQFASCTFQKVVPLYQDHAQFGE